MLYRSLFLAALSLECAIAQPAHHRHQHKHRRDLDDVNWNTVSLDLSSVDWKTVDYGQGSPQPATATTAAPAPSPPPAADNAPKQAATTLTVVPLPAGSPSPSSPDTGSSDTGFSGTKEKSQQSSGGQQSGDSTGATGGAIGKFGGQTAGQQGGNKDLYIGNVGTPYGYNMMNIPTDQAKTQKYSITFKNVGQKEIKVIVWQNPGRDGSPLGGKGEDPILTIPIPAGESRATAYDEDTHGAFSLDCPRGSDGSTTCVRGEYNFGDKCPKQWDNANGAQGWSAFDRSCIMGGCNDYLKMTCLNCPDDGTARRISDKGSFSFSSDQQTDASVPVPPGPVHILAEMSA
ncbi:MAG: hypothetical protein Q9190_004995 [Brigantiaea leucoxantha]